MKNKAYLRIIANVTICIILFTSIFSGCSKKESATNFKKILSQIYTYEMNVANIDINGLNISATEAFENLNNDGYFPNINYNDKSETNWLPAEHLYKLRDLAVSYVNPKGVYYKNSEAYLKIINALIYWQKVKPISTNWYMQEILTPQYIGSILVLMRYGKEHVPKETEKLMLRRMKKTGGKLERMTGANKADVALHYIYRGALAEDEDVIKTACEQAFSTLNYTQAEGFQYDGSYQQHGPQLYITGYGSSMINSICAIIAAVNNTEFAISETQFELFQNFINDTFIRVIRGQYSLYNVGGRSLARQDTLDMSKETLLFKKLKLIDKENTEKYSAVIDRLTAKRNASYLVETKNTHYFRSDYTLHTAPSYTFDVRTVSNRTYRNENGNNENLKGYFLSDGAYSIAVSGKEYYNIFPVWDFSMVPGTTTLYLDDIPKPKEWGTFGESEFAGGLSNGTVGVCAYAYKDSDFSLNISANKSYFILGDVIVCMGNGIKSHSNNEVRTTINQCNSNGNIYLINEDDTSEVLKNESTELHDIKGVYHDNVGYVFYDDNPKKLTNINQAGYWNDINSNINDEEPLYRNVFTLYESHGLRPANESYQYVILPGIKTKRAVEIYDKRVVTILSNIKDIQAVKTAYNDNIYAVFFKAGSLKVDNIKISVDKPCIIMLEKNKFYISNPDQTVGEINVKIKKGNKTQKEKVKMYSNGNKYAGKTICVG